MLECLKLSGGRSGKTEKAIIRGTDPFLHGWSSSGVREVVGMDQSDVPPGFVRRAWTVDAAGEPRYFLRLGVTLLPEAGILE